MTLSRMFISIESNLQYRVNNTVQGPMAGIRRGWGTPRWSLSQTDFLHLARAAQERKLALLDQITVHCAQAPAKEAISRHAQTGRFAVHRSPASNHQVGVPEQV